MSSLLNWGRGGLPLEPHLEDTRTTPIPNASIPPKCIVPLQSFEGQDIRWLLGPGDRVDEGTVLAQGAHGSLHSPIPGVIESLQRTLLSGGWETTAAHIRLEGSFFRSAEDKKPQLWSTRPPQALIQDLKDSGVLFCASPLTSLVPVREKKARILVINGLQSESYLTIPSHLFQQYEREIMTAIQIVQGIYQPETTLLAVHADMAAHYSSFEDLPFGLSYSEYRYPAAHPVLLTKALRRQHRKLLQDVGEDDMLMLTPQVLYWIHEALVMGRPVLDNFVAYGGAAFHHGGIIKARIGTPAANLILDAGGLKDSPQVMLHGGIHLGSPLTGLWNPVEKGTQGLLALAPSEVNPAPRSPCLRCGSCVEYCPVGLEPLELDLSLRKGDFARALNEGISSCIECGLCSTICPSRIPLMENFQQFLRNKEGKHA